MWPVAAIQLRARAQHEPDARVSRLFLLPGSVRLTEYEESLAFGVHSGTVFQNNPGAFYHPIQQTARTCGTDRIVVDTTPSMGCLNMVIVISCSFFLMPGQADFFSLNALELRKK